MSLTLSPINRAPVAIHTLSPHLDDARVLRVVDMYMELNTSDEDTGHYYRILDRAHLRRMLIKFLCTALGGLPFDAANMRRSHERLRIPRWVMERAIHHLRTALEEVGGMSTHKTEEVLAYAEILTLGLVNAKTQNITGDRDLWENQTAPPLSLPVAEGVYPSPVPEIRPEDRPWSEGQDRCAMAAKDLTRRDVALLADAFYERNCAHRDTVKFFEGVNGPGLRRMLASFLTHALGGNEYDVERMRQAHARIPSIDDTVFDAVLVNLNLALHETRRADNGLILRSCQADIIMMFAERTRKDVVPLSKIAPGPDISRMALFTRKIRAAIRSIGLGSSADIQPSPFPPSSPASLSGSHTSSTSSTHSSKITCPVSGTAGSDQALECPFAKAARENPKAFA